MKARRIHPFILFISVIAFPLTAMGEKGYDLNANPEIGLAVVSLSIGNVPPKAIAGFVELGVAVMKPDGEIDYVMLRGIAANTHGFFRKNESDFTDTWGKLIVLKLKPGDYALVDGKYHKNDVWVQELEMGVLRFRVIAGGATYVGNFEVMTEGVDTPFGWKTRVGSYSSVQDRTDRDVGLFLARNPKISRDQVQVEILHH